MTTTIKSEFGQELNITEPWNGDARKVALRCGLDHNRLYSRADLLAALDAVPAGKLAEAERKAADFEDRYETSHASRMHAEECYRREHARAEKAEADHEATKKAYRDLGASHAKLLEQRDALAATVERVQAVASDPGGFFYRDIRAALDPEPAFALPTEAGARFEATDNLSHEVTFRAVWNGPHIMYLNESTSVIWNNDNLLAGCTDFRLLDGAE